MKVLVEGNSIGEVYFSSIQSKLKNKMVLDKFMTTNDSKKEIIEDLILAFQKKEIGIWQYSRKLIPDSSDFHI